MSDKKRILMHVCCGPCAEWPIVSLSEEGYEITSFFSNPNIHPKFEQERRRDNAAKLMLIKNIPFISDDDYREDLWISEEWKGDSLKRCDMCYSIRMRRVAEEASRLGFSLFTTSLLVSPYQDHERVILAAEKAAKAAGIAFLYRDYRR